MPFPANTTLIDDFNRPDQTLNTAPWEAGVRTITGGLFIRSNVATGSGSIRGSRLLGNYGPDVDFYATWVTVVDFAEILVRLNPSTGTSWAGYVFSFSPGGGTFRIQRRDPGLTTTLASFPFSAVVGDKFGGEVRGNRLAGYKNTGSGWVLIGEVTDTAPINTTGGRVGLAASLDKIDDFHGGDAVTAVTVTGSASWSGESNLTGSGLKGLRGSASWSGESNVAANAGPRVVTGSTGLMGVWAASDLTVSGVKVVSGSASLSGQSDAFADGRKVGEEPPITNIRTLVTGESTGTATTLTLSQSVAIGERIIVISQGLETMGAITGVVDSRSNTYAKDVDLSDTDLAFGNYIAGGIEFWSSPITTALNSGDTITVSQSGPTGRRFVVIAGTNIGPVDKFGVLPYVNGQTYDGNTAALSQTNEVVFGVAWVETTPETFTHTPGAGFTELFDGKMGILHEAVEYRHAPNTSPMRVHGSFSGPAASSPLWSVYTTYTAAVTAPQVSGSASWSGESNVTSSGQKGLQGSATISGESGLASTGQRIVAGSASISGASGLFAEAGSQLVFGEASLSAQANLEAAGATNAIGASALSGASDLASAGLKVVQGVLGLSGNSDLASAGARTALGSTALSGNSNLASSSVRVTTSSWSVSGASNLASNSRRIALGGWSVSGTSTLTSSGFRTAFGASTLTGESTLTSAGFRTVRGTLVMSAESDLAGAGATIATGAWNVSGVSYLFANTGTNLIIGAQSMEGSSGLQTSGFKTALGASGLIASSTLAVASIRVQRSGAGFSGASGITTNGARLAYGRGNFSGVANLAFSGTTLATGTVILSGTGTLFATTRQRHLLPAGHIERVLRGHIEGSRHGNLPKSTAGQITRPKVGQIEIT